MNFSEMLSGAASGAGMGMALGPVGAGVGAGVGLLTSVFAGNAQRKAEEEARLQKERFDKGMEKYNQSLNHNSALAEFPTQGIQRQGFYMKKGGKLPMFDKNPVPQYEVEKGEVILHDPFNPPALEKSPVKTSDTAVTVRGNTHKQGGVKGRGGNFVIPEKQKVSKKTFSQMLKYL